MKLKHAHVNGQSRSLLTRTKGSYTPDKCVGCATGIGIWCKMVALTKEIAVEITPTFFLYFYFEPPGRIYSERCPWVNGWQLFHNDFPWLLGLSAVGIAWVTWIILDWISFFVQKRRTRVMEHSQMGWTGVSFGAFFSRFLLSRLTHTCPTHSCLVHP